MTRWLRFSTRLRAWLERFRMAGYDLDVDGPRYVALDIALHICVLPGYFRSEVLRAVQAVLGAGVFPDGRRALLIQINTKTHPFALHP